MRIHIIFDTDKLEQKPNPGTPEHCKYIIRTFLNSHGVRERHTEQLTNGRIEERYGYEEIVCEV